MGKFDFAKKTGKVSLILRESWGGNFESFLRIFEGIQITEFDKLWKDSIKKKQRKFNF